MIYRNGTNQSATEAAYPDRQLQVLVTRKHICEIPAEQSPEVNDSIIVQDDHIRY